MIIPFFISHAGCPHQCVFCNQKNISGQIRPVDPATIPKIIITYLDTQVKKGPVQAAFYGGSFTALPRHEQNAYLEAVRPFLQSGQIESIRLSTRPDCISREILAFLKDHSVSTVELGAQSMDDRVLARVGRGHAAGDTMTAVKLLKENGFTIGLQLMAGLPGDSADIFMNTVDTVIRLKPRFVRIYPLLVLKGTPMEELYKNGGYTPLPLDDAVLLCRNALLRFEQAGIEVIRIGLQPTRELEKPGTILAGPYHPAFRQLVESSILLDRMRRYLSGNGKNSGSLVFFVNPRDVSAAVGQKRSNLGVLKKEFGLKNIGIRPDRNVPRMTARVGNDCEGKTTAFQTIL
jgi:histone acetyltransferase (RNA polymerase elongator complex component)